MKIKLLASVAIGGAHQEAGSVLDLKDADAQNLIGRGRAVPYTDAPAIENRAITSKTDDAITKRKAKLRKGD